MSRPPKPPSTRTRVRRSRAPHVRRDGHEDDGGGTRGPADGSTSVATNGHGRPSAQEPGLGTACEESAPFVAAQPGRFVLQSSAHARTILLVEGINDRTKRRCRAYRLPSGEYVVVETVGGMG